MLALANQGQTVDHPVEGNERIFASRYQLELPSKEHLRKLLLEWREEERNGYE